MSTTTSGYASVQLFALWAFANALRNRSFDPEQFGKDGELLVLKAKETLQTEWVCFWKWWVSFVNWHLKLCSQVALLCL